MVQAKFSLTEQQVTFLNNYRLYGYNDKSEVVRAALERLQRVLHDEEMERSAQLCAELYDCDLESQAWVESAVTDWPQ